MDVSKELGLADLEGEVWRGIQNADLDYKVSNLGRVKNCYSGSRKSKILKPFHIKGGYLVSTLKCQRKWKKFYIHRLVASEFISNSNNYPQVNHKDGNKKNNYYLNLEWTSPKENILHSYDTGLAKIGQERSGSKLTNKDVREIKYSVPRMRYKEISKIYGIAPSTIAKIRSGQSWKHIKK